VDRISNTILSSTVNVVLLTCLLLRFCTVFCAFYFIVEPISINLANQYFADMPTDKRLECQNRMASLVFNFGTGTMIFNV
jgi:hypothetical protein